MKSKFSKSLISLIIVSSVLPAAAINTSAMERMKRIDKRIVAIDAQKKYEDIKKEFGNKQFVNGLNQSDVIETLHQLVPCAMRELFEEKIIKNPNLRNCTDYLLKDICKDTNLCQRTLANLLTPITPREKNEPHNKLWWAMYDDAIRDDLKFLVFKLAKNHCHKLGISI